MFRKLHSLALAAALAIAPLGAAFAASGNAPAYKTNSGSNASASGVCIVIAPDTCVKTADPLPVTGTVSIDATGLATSSGQTTGNGTLTAIAGHVDGLETLGAATNTKLDTLHTDLSGAATAANQATANTSLATIATNTARLAQGSTTAGQQGPLVQCAVTTTAPTYTTGQTNPFSCDLNGRLRMIGGPSSASTAGIAAVVSASVEACHVIKASAGNLYGVTVAPNGSAGANGWVLFLNATSAPADGAVSPVEWGRVTTNGLYSWSAPGGVPLYFSTGIVICLSSTGPFTKTGDANAAISGKAQ